MAWVHLAGYAFSYLAWNQGRGQISLELHRQKSMQKTFQFTTQCNGDISHAFKTAKITVFDHVMCKRPDVPLQAELLELTIQLRTSQLSILAVMHGQDY